MRIKINILFSVIILIIGICIYILSQYSVLTKLGLAAGITLNIMCLLATITTTRFKLTIQEYPIMILIPIVIITGVFFLLTCQLALADIYYL